MIIRYGKWNFLCSGESDLPDRTLTMEKTDGEIMEDNLDWEKEADMDAALDFADSF